MKSLSILLLVLVVFSCKSSVPGDVLPAKKMQSVLWDVMQADAMAEHYAVTDSTFKGLSKHIGYYQKVFLIHKINKEDFTRSLSYYQNHPSHLKPILDSLKSYGERLQLADTVKTTSPTILVDSNFKKRSMPIKRR